MMLSRRVSNDSHGENSSYFVGWQEYEKNPYHELDNPSGIVQLGLAENQVCYDVVESWLKTNSDGTGMRRNGRSIFRELALFQDYHGLPSSKNALGQYMAKIRGNRVEFDPKKLVLFAGATSANEALMFCLAQKGDAILLPTPYYPGFDRDLQWRTDVQIVPVLCSSFNGFKITELGLENAYQQALELDLNVKGILLTNPSNPLGTTMTSPELNTVIDFAMDKNIHIISDEVYSGTTFGLPDFISIAEAVILRGLQHSELWSRIHIVSGLSKDLGLPGFRVGMLYSNNEFIVSAATKMSSFGLVSSQTQFLVSTMLFDEKFVSRYMTENKTRLEKRRKMLVSGLEKVGIRCLKSNAGLFCWADLGHLLRTRSFEAEMELWSVVLREVGLNISPGSSFHCAEPGWFRICFANTSEDVLNVALKRLKKFVDETTTIQPQMSYVNNLIATLSYNDREADR